MNSTLSRFLRTEPGEEKVRCIYLATFGIARTRAHEMASRKLQP